MEKFIINIGRQLGSGGREIGKALAQHYEIAYYDKELIRIAAEESGLSPELFEKAHEGNQHEYSPKDTEGSKHASCLVTCNGKEDFLPGVKIYSSHVSLLLMLQ